MIADRIKELRERNNYTQIALSKRLSITRSSINAWEMGISVPSVQYLIELSKLFGVSTDYILELDNKVNVDITALNDVEKNIVLNLVNYFKENKV